MQAEMIFEQEKGEEDMTATEAIVQLVKELAEKCKTIEEFREALAKIIAKK